MNKQSFFQKAVRDNRKRLIKEGFPAPTVHTWEFGKRQPKYETAKRLAKILRIPLGSIPYIRVQINN
jgi:transcriptional regulator with XRE-family HTH domain